MQLATTLDAERFQLVVLGVGLGGLHIASRVTAIDPEFATRQDDGVTWGRAVWQDGALRVELQRHGYAFQQ